MSFIGSGIPPMAVAQDSSEESAMPTPGKHQLRPTPLQIAEHRIEQQNKRITHQNEEIERLTALLEEQGKKIDAQSKQIEALTEKAEVSGASLTAIEGRLIEMTELLEKLRARPAATATAAAPTSSPIIPSAPPEAATPSEPPIPRAEPVSPAEGEIYIIKRGDNLTNIAKQHGTTVAEILKLNKIEDERKLQIGQKLILPKP